MQDYNRKQDVEQLYMVENLTIQLTPETVDSIYATILYASLLEPLLISM